MHSSSTRLGPAWLLDTVAVGDDIEVTLALRYEDITTEREEYADTRDLLVDYAGTRQRSGCLV